MQHNRLLPAMALAVAVGASALVGCANRPAAGPAPAAPSADNAAPRPGQVGAQAHFFDGTTRDGRPFRLADHREKTMLINFFSPG